jgi:AcrR family transcriptional regulator
MKPTNHRSISGAKRAPFPKGGKRDRTRATLIEAAKEVIRQKGYHAVSLEEVAARAEMSRGAIYGNFKNREDLIAAVVSTLWEPVVPRLKMGATFQEQMRIIGKAVAAAARARRPMAVGAASFQLYALSNELMRRRVAEENAEIYRRLATGIVKFIQASELPMPANKFVRVLHALTDGLMFEHFMAPNLITKDVIISAFEAFAKKGKTAVVKYPPAE